MHGEKHAPQQVQKLKRNEWHPTKKLLLKLLYHNIKEIRYLNFKSQKIHGNTTKLITQPYKKDPTQKGKCNTPNIFFKIK